MPPLIRFCLVNALIGALLGWLFIAGLLYFDMGGLGRLVFRSPDKWIAILTLMVASAVTFGGAAVTTAVLLQAQIDEDDRMRMPKFLKRWLSGSRDDNRSGH